MYLFLNRTRLGRYIYSIGGNQEAAVVSGIQCLTGKDLGLFLEWPPIRDRRAHPHLTVYLGTAHPGWRYALLESLGAVVIGGTSLFGGEGGILRTLLGS